MISLAEHLSYCLNSDYEAPLLSNMIKGQNTRGGLNGESHGRSGSKEIHTLTRTNVCDCPINNHCATTTNMSIFNIFVSTVIKKTLIKAFSFYIYIQLLKIHICISAVSITIEISGEKFKIDKPADWIGIIYIKQLDECRKKKLNILINGL